MKTECKSDGIQFQDLKHREVIGKFDGGTITSDGGGILLREVEKKTGIIRDFASCFKDYRDENRIEHTIEELISQRIYGLSCGYDDLNDHDRLRCDPLFGLLCGKEDPSGSDRKREEDRGKPLAGKSTLNRLELTPADANEKSRYKKIVFNSEKADEVLIDIFIRSYRVPPKRIIIDADPTDDPIHGNQEGRFFHGYYKCYCYLPLYLFCGDHLLCARLRSSGIDASEGTVEELERIVPQIRQSWPDVKITLRGDSGFCRDKIMLWCEDNGVDYVLGLAKNDRLKKLLSDGMNDAQAIYEETGEPSKVYRDFYYQTIDSWNKVRRVIGKAEYLQKGENPRFVVTTFRDIEPKELYEDNYCPRGEMENRIKEQQLGLFADRTSTSEMRANQIRLYFSSFAYVLMSSLRRTGLKETNMEKAQCGTIRTKLLKIGTQVRVTVRKVWLSFSEAYPYKEIFLRIYHNLTGISEPLPV
jgi:hypothetical protein